MRVAVDVCIGKRGVRDLERAGHVVVARAVDWEADHVWFGRALQARAEVVISPDADLAHLAYEHRVLWFRPRRGERDVEAVKRFVRWVRGYERAASRSRP